MSARASAYTYSSNLELHGDALDLRAVKTANSILSIGHGGELDHTVVRAEMRKTHPLPVSRSTSA